MTDIVTLPDIEPINYEILMRALYVLYKTGNEYERNGAEFLIKYFENGMRIQ